MGTLNTKLTLTGTSADFGAALSLSVEKGLDVIKPYGSISKLNVTTDSDADAAAGIANGTQIMSLKKDEFALFPYDNGVDPASGDDNQLILQASSGTINVDFAVFTVAT